MTPENIERLKVYCELREAVDECAPCSVTVAELRYLLACASQQPTTHVVRHVYDGPTGRMLCAATAMQGILAGVGRQYRVAEVVEQSVKLGDALLADLCNTVGGK